LGHPDSRRPALEHDRRGCPLLLLILDRRVSNQKSQIRLPQIDGFDYTTVGLIIAAMAPSVEIGALLFTFLFTYVLICWFFLSLLYLFRLLMGVWNSNDVLQQFNVNSVHEIYTLSSAKGIRNSSPRRVFDS
jgi:hypothetical protein